MSQNLPAAPHRPGALPSRLLSGLAAAGLFAALAWADAHGTAKAPPMAWLLPLVIAVAAGAGREAVRLATAAGVPLAPGLVPLGAAVIAAAPALPLPETDPLATIGSAAVATMSIIAAVFVSGVARYAAGDRSLARAVGSVATAVAIGLPLAFMVGLRLIRVDADDTDPFVRLLPVVSLIAVVKAGDIAAYAVGSTLGRHRMAPVLSPGKTWEGAAASLAASVAAAWLIIGPQMRGRSAGQPLGGWPLYGVAVGVAGMLGDLAESLVKRELHAKDSGRLLGGMGGFLDLVDSLLLAAPVAWLLWVLG
ncbi:MAG: hypothetical protein FJ286_06985 [Planctomycetes bacterium]|nr:hypothetical protein [Planctomycetota bacterium]